MPEVTIIVVNTNTRDYLHQCLTSLREDEGVDKEVIVIENNSDDDSAQMLSEEFAQVKVLANDEKLGFSLNNNMGAEVGKAPILLFLNPDTRVPTGSLRGMLEVIDQHPEVGVFGGKCLDVDGDTERSTGRYPTLTSIFLDRFLNRAAPLQPLLQRFSQRHYRGYDRERLVDWVTGAFLWIRRDLFQAIGGWDSSIFLYYDDTDLCLRAKKAGYAVMYTPKSVIHHYHNKTPMDTPRRKGLMRNGLHIFTSKHYSPARRWLYHRVLRLPEIETGTL